MAISVNEVYQTILAVANKEQRGYITPQEFNLFAEQAQMDIFQQYFYDLNQFRRDPGNDTIKGDLDTALEEKITLFESTVPIGIGASGSAVLSSTTFKLVDFYVTYSGGAGPSAFSITSEANFVSRRELGLYVKSRKTQPTTHTPVYTREGNILRVFPNVNDYIVNPNYNVNIPITGTSGSSTIIQKPAKPNWTYIIVNNKPLYNATANDHQDFQLHNSEKPLLIKKILQLAGISIKDYNITQFAAQDEIKTIQQQKS